MMKKFIKKVVTPVLVTALFAETIMIPAKQADCANLKLNNNIKLNKTKTYTKTGLYKEETLFPKGKKIKVKYTIKCSRKSSGKNYKVTYNVNYKYLEDAKVQAEEITYDDWWWGFTYPSAMYTVFNYKTGKSLEVKNDLGVTVLWSSFFVTLRPNFCHRVYATP